MANLTLHHFAQTRLPLRAHARVVVITNTGNYVTGNRRRNLKEFVTPESTSRTGNRSRSPGGPSLKEKYRNNSSGNNRTNGVRKWNVLQGHAAMSNEGRGA